MLTNACCLVGIGIALYLYLYSWVSGYAHVFILLYVIIVVLVPYTRVDRSCLLTYYDYLMFAHNICIN